MENSKILRHLSSLRSTGLNEFRRYMHNDFFNRKARLSQLADLLIAMTKGQQKPANKAFLYGKLFEEEQEKFLKMNAVAQERHLRKRMDMLIYELKRHLEDYLVWKGGQKKNYHRDLVLLSMYEELEADAFYFELYEKLKARLDQAEPKPIWNHLYSHNLAQNAFEHSGFQRWTTNWQGIGPMQEELDIYFVANKLMNSYVLLLADIMTSQKAEIQMLDEMLEYAEKPPFKGNLYIDVYGKAIRDLRSHSFTLEGLEYLKNRMMPELPDRHKDEQIGLFNVLVNYALIWYQFSSGANVEVHFDLYRNGLENGYYLRKGVISYSDFHNISCVATNAGKLEWADQFVLDYGHRLPNEIRLPTVTLELARIRHVGGEHREALKILSKKQVFTNSMDKTLERMLRIRCYYELEENDLLENLLESTRKQTERHPDMGEAIRTQVRNFLRMTLRLYLLRQSPADTNGVEAIVSELEDEKVCAAQLWLIRQAEKLRSTTKK